jgi:hypothetical protein
MLDKVVPQIKQVIRSECGYVGSTNMQAKSNRDKMVHPRTEEKESGRKFKSVQKKK